MCIRDRLGCIQPGRESKSITGANSAASSQLNPVVSPPITIVSVAKVLENSSREHSKPPNIREVLPYLVILVFQLALEGNNNKAIKNTVRPDWHIGLTVLGYWAVKLETELTTQRKLT